MPDPSIPPIMKALGSIFLKFGLTTLINNKKQKEVNALLNETVRTWSSQLPIEHNVDPNSLFTTEFESEHEPPYEIFRETTHGRIPAIDDIAKALLEQWNLVKKHISEPQPFYLLEEEEAASYLNDLASRLHHACLSHDRVVLRSIHVDVTKLSDSNTRSASEIAASSSNRSIISSAFASGNAEIDIARDLLNKGEVGSSISKLNEIASRHWDNLSQRERFRLKANLGFAFHAKGELSKAAKELIACQAFQSDDANANASAALGYLCLEDSQSALRFVDSALSIDPSCSLALSLKIRWAKQARAFAETESDVPLAMRSDPNVAFALSLKAAELRENSAAEQYARKATSGDPMDPTAAYQLAAAILQSDLQAFTSALASPAKLDNKRMTEAIDLCKYSVSKFAKLANSREEASSRYVLGRCYSAIGDDTNAISQLVLAYDLNPKDVQIAIHLAFAYLDRKEVDKAITILRSVASIDQSLTAALLLSQTLRDRSAPGDVAEALLVLEGSRSLLAKCGEPATVEYFETIFGLYHTAGRSSDVNTFLNENVQLLKPLSEEIARMIAGRLANDASTARNHAERAIALVGDSTAPWLRHVLAKQLIKLELYSETFELLRNWTPRTQLSLTANSLIIAAQHLKEDGFLVEFLSQLRLAGTTDKQLVELELGLRQRYHDFRTCAEIIEQLLSNGKLPEVFINELTIRRVCINRALSGQLSAPLALDALPKHNEASPHLVLTVVQLLLEQGAYHDAQMFAYGAYRHNRESALVHKALILSYLLDKTETPTLEHEVIYKDSAVQLKDIETGQNRWVIIEDGLDPQSVCDEYPPDHNLCAKLLGRKKDDKVPHSQSHPFGREYEVVQIVPKQLCRFWLCLAKYEEQFDEAFLRSVRVAKDDGTPDFERITKILKAQEHARQQINSNYKKSPLSTSSYAILTNIEVLDATRALAAEGLPIRCCLGNAAELEDANGVIKNAKALVLDESAIATLILTNKLAMLQLVDAEIIVPASCLLSLKQIVQQGHAATPQGKMCYVNERIVFFEHDDVANAQWLEAIEVSIESIESVATIVNGLDLANIPARSRAELIQMFGRATAEAIAAAHAKGAALWSDDVLVATIARQYLNVSRVWTQVVGRFLLEAEKTTEAEMNSLTAALIALGYKHTMLSVECARSIAANEGWDARKGGFVSLCSYIRNTDSKDDWVQEIAEGLLSNIYGNMPDFSGSYAVQQILNDVGSRRDGRDIIVRILRRVPILVRHRPQSEILLRHDIETWLTNSVVAIS
jgi:Flp pilus assembly protein TadD